MAWNASEAVGKLLLAAAPAFVLSPDGARLLWANPDGAARLGADNLANLLTEDLPPHTPLRKQIAHLNRHLRGNTPQIQRLRVGHSASTPLELVQVQRIRNVDGVSGLLLQPVEKTGEVSATVSAERLVEWLASDNHYAAVLSVSGEVIASSGA